MNFERYLFAAVLMLPLYTPVFALGYRGRTLFVSKVLRQIKLNFQSVFNDLSLIDSILIP
jgi:hypothetical protein